MGRGESGVEALAGRDVPTKVSTPPIPPAVLNLKIPLISPAVKTADWYTKQAESLLPDIPQCALAYFLYQPGNLFPGVLAIKAN